MEYVWNKRPCSHILLSINWNKITIEESLDIEYKNQVNSRSSNCQKEKVFLWKENFQIKTQRFCTFFFPGLSNCIPSLRLLTDYTTLSSIWRKFHENESISMLDVDLLLKQPMFLSVVRTTHRNRNGLHWGRRDIWENKTS